MINTLTKALRIEISRERRCYNLEKIIKKHIVRGNKIIADGWDCYNSLNNPINGYTYNGYNHGSCDLGYGFDSTIHIESTWHLVKSKIKDIYKTIPSKNLFLFLN